MNEEIKNSIKNLVNYLYTDEKKNFEEDDKPKNHIFRDVQRVANFLSLDIEAEIDTCHASISTVDLGGETGDEECGEPCVYRSEYCEKHYQEFTEKIPY